MTKILALIFSILLIFFPDSAFVLANYQDWSFPGKAEITDSIVEAFNNDDADAIEEMLSQQTKENGENLNQKIKEMISVVDGEIIEYRDNGNGGDGDYVNNGVYVKYVSWDTYVKTDTSKEYVIGVSWDTVNTVNPKKVGMRTILLTDLSYNVLARVYIPID